MSATRRSQLFYGLLALTIAAPSVAAEEANDPSKHFMFYLSGVSAADARADLIYCMTQAHGLLSFNDKIGTAGIGGALGGALGGYMASADRTRMRNAVMRKCMALHGYERYALDRATWQVIVDGGDIAVGADGGVATGTAERLARLASGSPPSTVKLAP